MAHGQSTPHPRQPDQPEWTSRGHPFERYANMPNGKRNDQHESAETDSLLARNGGRKPSAEVLTAHSVVAFFVILFMGFSLFMHFTNCPLYPWTMKNVRKGWENEVGSHELLRQNWTMQEYEHTLLEESWKRQAQWHEKEKERKEREEEQHQEQVRKAWEAEAERHRQALEERNRRETERMDSQRRKWQREIDEHDRLVEERRRREEEERQKLNMFWGQVESHQCTTYATREYTALLMNLPTTWEHRVEACKATALEIHGVSYLPKTCEDKGPGVVLGRWEINQNEPDCATFWNWYKDKGCTSQQSGKRRIEHYLENLPHGGDWKEFCATTPASFRGMHFIGAQECFQYNQGTYGHWEIDDSSC
ncbi:hypothetical protein PAXINDRAFT_21809 [Paxillus involutus ATCC 200175]|uniref:Uncharacterized protein n=1 Tax=Paxillus involutus ATCC 200175 TaxID=664439 RepID=A0A0C9TCA7_PAXIN|nr:hypothetical protein PAXINDRAFT_21809 [Paxillus involutus ATCC 200175]